jgi:hypothetical protein
VSHCYIAHVSHSGTHPRNLLPELQRDEARTTLSAATAASAITQSKLVKRGTWLQCVPAHTVARGAAEQHTRGGQSQPSQVTSASRATPAVSQQHPVQQRLPTTLVWTMPIGAAAPLQGAIALTRMHICRLVKSRSCQRCTVGCGRCPAPPQVHQGCAASAVLPTEVPSPAATRTAQAHTSTRRCRAPPAVACCTRCHRGARTTTHCS